jgi:hypothetical protein
MFAYNQISIFTHDYIQSRSCSFQVPIFWYSSISCPIIYLKSSESDVTTTWPQQTGVHIKNYYTRILHLCFQCHQILTNITFK